MLATRMFFWWNVALVDPMKPAVKVPATKRVFIVTVRAQRPHA